MDECSDKEMMDHGLRSTNQDNTEFDDLQFKFPRAADNPEVLKSRILSHYNNLCGNSNTCDQGNLSNPVIPRVGRHFGMDTTASMDQQILINSQSHRNHACESGRKNPTIPFWNSNRRNVQDDIGMEMSLTNNFETITNSQLSHSSEKNVQTNQVLNSELGYRSAGCNMASGSRNRLDNNGMQMGNTIHDIHWKKKLLYHRMIAEDTQDYIGSRHKISRISGQFLSSNCETDVVNYDSVAKNSPKNRMKFANSQFALINNAIPNIVQDNQERQIVGNLGGNRLDCAMAQSVPQQSYLYNIPPLESIPSIQRYPFSLNNKDALDGAHSIRQTGHFNAMESVGSNVASNISISPKYNASSDVFDYRLPKNDSLLSINPTFFAPGPFDSHEKNYTSKVCESQFQFRSPSQLPVTHRNDRKTLYCMICKNELDKHVSGYAGKCHYKCCACMHTTNFKNNLQKHNINHLLKQFCNICAEVIWDIDSHGVDQRCKVCGENFHCQTLLETHLLIHDGYFTENCRVCMKLIDQHNIEVEGKMRFKCCQCSSYFDYLSGILRHLHIHTGLRLFKCYECGGRFTQKSALNKHLKSCLKCQT